MGGWGTGFVIRKNENCLCIGRVHWYNVMFAYLVRLKDAVFPACLKEGFQKC